MTTGSMIKEGLLTFRSLWTKLVKQKGCDRSDGDKRPVTYLSLLLRQLHVVKDPEDDPEQVLPPVFLKGVSIGLHHFKHHCEPPGKFPQTHLVFLMLRLTYTFFF